MFQPNGDSVQLLFNFQGVFNFFRLREQRGQTGAKSFQIIDAYIKIDQLIGQVFAGNPAGNDGTEFLDFFQYLICLTLWYLECCLKIINFLRVSPRFAVNRLCHFHRGIHIVDTHLQDRGECHFPFFRLLETAVTYITINTLGHWRFLSYETINTLGHWHQITHPQSRRSTTCQQ